MSQLFSIGETAKIHRISKQTLIYYDSIGLLKPTQTNKFNNYRFYSLEDFATLDVILFLKVLKVPLKNIKKYLDSRNVPDSLSFYEEQLSITEQEILKLKAIKEKIKYTMHLYKNYKGADKIYEPFIKRKKSFNTLEAPIKPPYDPTDVDLSLKELLMYVEQTDFLSDYTMGSIVTREDLKTKSFLKNRATFIIINQKIEHEYFKKTPSGKYAVIFHHGTYETIASSYEKLLNYIAKHNYKIISDAYETMIFDCFVVKDEKKYLTEISILIEKGEV